MITNDLFEVYLINMNKAKYRLELMEKEFKKHDISFHRISAADAQNLEEYKFTIKNKYDRNLVPGEIACYLSHIKTLKRFLNSANQYALIFEDDALLCDDFKNIIEKAILNHKNNLSDKHKWDILKLINRKR